MTRDLLAQIAPANIHRNLSPAALVEMALARGEAQLSSVGALNAVTGKYTGRSPKDKFLVDDAETHARVDWGPINQAMSPETFDALLPRLCDPLHGQDVFVFDGFAGADPHHQIAIRVITQYAWHSLFAQQLFLRPTPEQLSAHSPQFTLLDVPAFQAAPERDGTRSETVIALNLSQGVGLIGGTEYAGEIKKSIFTVLNYLLPQRNVFPMHCSANVGRDNDVALFFGLSGTGKTTLSADPSRRLIGDDEHGWSPQGVFNFEGGCYAKCIRLSATGEPEIWDAIQFGTVLENVMLDAATRVADYDDATRTENTRAAYPIHYIPQALLPSIGGHPRTILFLTADASGVLPPLSRLTPTQAMYHFLSGYTSKLAGTERGVTQPEPNFSACFGAPFWPLPPTHYAQMLGERLAAHPVQCYLVNTGWTGGPYGVGQRIALSVTRALVQAALDGTLNNTPIQAEPFFGLHIPHSVTGVPSELLHPRDAWPNPTDYDHAAQALAGRFAENFTRFPSVDASVRAAGPHQ